VLAEIYPASSVGDLQAHRVAVKPFEGAMRQAMSESE